MSGIPYVELGSLNGTRGFVRTSGFVNWTEDVASHMPRQRVRLGDKTTSGKGVVCTVFTDEITLEEGCGYYFGGVDRIYDRYDEVQLTLGKKSWAEKFYDPNDGGKKGTALG
jgi:hypothetical protein